MAATKNEPLKQIVYLFGAGATQAELNYLGVSGVNVLMRNSEHGLGIATRVLNRIPERWRRFLGEDEGRDIEKLISLLAASSVDDLIQLADRMRRQYFREIRNGLVVGKMLSRPSLATGLLEMHQVDRFKQKAEVLTGVVTTNHDGLLQVASQKVFGDVNAGFPFSSEDFSDGISNGTPAILQLHGSFTWTFASPTNISRLTRDSVYSADTIWIPPTILKESKNYPFNKLAGLAYELLAKKCDVLRIIGSSLTQNDWNVLSLIFNAQRHKELGRHLPFRVELITSHKTGLKIAEDCGYLKNLVPIGFLTEGNFDPYKDENFPSEMKNVFAYWLKEKIYYHRRREDIEAEDLTETMTEIAGGI
jgi:hypothetical protein